MKSPNKKVEDWNKKVSVGARVTVELDSGTFKETTTRSKAQVLPGNTPVIWLEGLSGCYLLDRVRPMKEEKI